jgi:hypothetical protein
MRWILPKPPPTVTVHLFPPDACQSAVMIGEKVRYQPSDKL